MDDSRQKVGVGLLLLKGNSILLGVRKGSHGQGEYSLAGGHLEYGESFEECALRELREEAGLSIKVTSPEFLCVTNLRKYPPNHYIDIGMYSQWISGEPQNIEPDKRVSWKWYSLDNLPSPLFGCTENYLEAYKTGRVYFDK